MQEKETTQESTKTPFEIVTETGTLKVENGTEETLLQVLQMVFGD